MPFFALSHEVPNYIKTLKVMMQGRTNLPNYLKLWFSKFADRIVTVEKSSAAYFTPVPTTLVSKERLNVAKKEIYVSDTVSAQLIDLSPSEP